MTKSTEVERNKDEGAWIDELPELPEIPKGDKRQILIIPKINGDKSKQRDKKEDDNSG